MGYRLYAKRDMMHRHNSDFEGEFDGNVIMGFKTQFTMAYAGRIARLVREKTKVWGSI